MGYVTCLLTSNSRQFSQRNEYPDVGMMIYCNLYDYDRIREMISYLEQLPLTISAIVSFIDPWCSVAARLSEVRGLPAFSAEAMRLMENKLKTREALKNTLHNPRFVSIPATAGGQIHTAKKLLPAVVKYIDSNGSRDVFYSPDRDSLYRNFRILTNLYPEGTILVEEFLEGPQYIVEVLAIDGDINIVAVVAQEIKLINNHFIIIGYSLLVEPEPNFLCRLMLAVKTVLGKFGFKNGPCHLEMRNVKGTWKLIEINPRISGAGMNAMIEIGLGINLARETLKLAVGKKPDLEPKQKIPTYAEYITVAEAGILHKVIGRREIEKDPNVKYVYVKPRRGRLITPPESLGDRYAYVIATGSTSDEAMKNARQAAEKISFIYEPLDPSINNLIHSQT